MVLFGENTLALQEMPPERIVDRLHAHSDTLAGRRRHTFMARLVLDVTLKSLVASTIEQAQAEDPAGERRSVVAIARRLAFHYEPARRSAAARLLQVVPGNARIQPRGRHLVGGHVAAAGGAPHPGPVSDGDRLALAAQAKEHRTVPGPLPRLEGADAAPALQTPQLDQEEDDRTGLGRGHGAELASRVTLYRDLWVSAAKPVDEGERGRAP
jgi:hypothetical protein